MSADDYGPPKWPIFAGFSRILFDSWEARDSSQRSRMSVHKLHSSYNRTRRALATMSNFQPGSMLKRDASATVCCPPIPPTLPPSPALPPVPAFPPAPAPRFRTDRRGRHLRRHCHRRRPQRRRSLWFRPWRNCPLFRCPQRSPSLRRSIATRRSRLNPRPARARSRRQSPDCHGRFRRSRAGGTRSRSRRSESQASCGLFSDDSFRADPGRTAAVRPCR